MHGFGLTYLLDTTLKNTAARLAFSKPLRGQQDLDLLVHDPTDINSLEDKWYYIENLQKRDRFLIALAKRFGKHLLEKNKGGIRRLLTKRLPERLRKPPLDAGPEKNLTDKRTFVEESSSSERIPEAQIIVNNDY